MLHGIDHFFAYTFGMDAVKEVLSWKLGHKDPFRCSICGVCMGVHFNEVIPDWLGHVMWVIRSPQLRQQHSARRKTIRGQVDAILKNNSGGGPEYNFQSLSLHRSGWQLGDFFAMAQGAFAGAVGAARKRPSSKLPHDAWWHWMRDFDKKASTNTIQHQNQWNLGSCESLPVRQPGPTGYLRNLEKLVADAPSLEQAIERRFDQKLPALLKRLSEAQIHGCHGRCSPLVISESIQTRPTGKGSKSMQIWPFWHIAATFPKRHTNVMKYMYFRQILLSRSDFDGMMAGCR